MFCHRGEEEKEGVTAVREKSAWRGENNMNMGSWGNGGGLVYGSGICRCGLALAVA